MSKQVVGSAKTRKKWDRKYYLKNREKRIKQARENYLDNKDRAKFMAHQRYERNKDRCLQLVHKQALLYPERIKARNIVTEAIRTKQLKKLDCKLCGADQKENRICAHHEDYSRPLEVIWLCVSCHKRLHYMRKQDKCA